MKLKDVWSSRKEPGIHKSRDASRKTLKELQPLMGGGKSIPISKGRKAKEQ